MKSRTILPVATFLALAGLLVIRAGGSEDSWEFVVDAEARSRGTVVATRQARASVCEDDGEGACHLVWNWEGETLPANAHEWVRGYFLHRGETIPVVLVPYWCDADLEVCHSEMADGGMVIEPSAGCLVELADACGMERGERGFWYGGTLGSDPGERVYAFYEPLYLEWHGNCPLPPATYTPAPTPPTYTPGPTYTPDPTPTCRPTWTPAPTATPYPTSTPYPTATEYPPQPPF